MTLDDCCDGTCSSLDTTGSYIINHEQVERGLDKALRPDLRQRYISFMKRLKEQAYRVLTLFRAPSSY